jgi:hypothetical protein
MRGEPLIIEGQVTDEQEAYYTDLFVRSNQNGHYIPYLSVNGKTIRQPPFWDKVARSLWMSTGKGK